jgi:hypothetical protein
MENISRDNQDFYEQDPSARAALDAFRAIRERHEGKIQFRDIVDLATEEVTATGPVLVIDLTDVLPDSSDADQQSLTLEVQTQTALTEITHRRHDEAEPCTVSFDRLSDIEDFDEYMHAIDTSNQATVPVAFVGQAEQLLDPQLRTTLFKSAGTTALVETLRIEQTGDIYRRVELHNLGDN